jgi:integrase
MPSPQFWKEFNVILVKHNKLSTRGNHRASFETQYKRAEILDQGFRTLWKLGFHMKHPYSFRERHMHALAKHWEEKGYKDIQTRISIFRIYGNLWLGKANMIKESVVYVSNPDSVKRKYVTNVDKTWSGQGVDVLALIEAVGADDPRVGLVLEIKFAFGLRLKESLLLRPHRADKTAYLDVNRGTKGGRDRTVAIEEDMQRDVLERACRLIERPAASMIPDGVSFVTYRSHVYYLCRKHGITRNQLGIVPSGLRHEYACAWYEKKTGAKAPVKGANVSVSQELDAYIRAELTENLGHSRSSIAGCYIGTRRLVKKDGATELTNVQAPLLTNLEVSAPVDASVDQRETVLGSAASLTIKPDHKEPIP